MKRILYILILAAVANTAVAQEQKEQKLTLEQSSIARFEHNQKIITDFIDRQRNVDDITVVEIGKTMTNILAIKLFEEGDDESAQLLRSIESIEIVVDSSKDKSSIEEELFALPERCRGFELMSSINSKDELFRFYFAEHPRTKQCEFLMLVRSPEERIMLYITGEFSVGDISSLSSLGEGIVK